MPNRQDLDTALDNIVTLLQAQGADIQNLISLVQALPPPGDPDFTAELAKVTAAASAAQASKDAVDAEIAVLNPPPPPQPQP